jgi:hypothetical protein
MCVIIVYEHNKKPNPDLSNGINLIEVSHRKQDQYPALLTQLTVDLIHPSG